MSEKRKIRVAKLDNRNYVVQEYKTTQKKSGEEVSEWVEIGFYGCHLEHAARFALLAGCTEGKSLLGEFKAASEAIVNAMKEKQ